jgi:predicted phage terminase large subunit-like protein
MNKDAKDLVKNNLLAFAMKAFKSLNHGQSLDRQPYLDLLADMLTRVSTGELKRLIVNLPPRHGKTFVVSVCLPAWILAHQPSAKILLLSYGQDLADKIARSIRNVLRAEWYQQTFRTRIAADRAKVDDFATTAGGGVRSISIEGGVTGVGADFIIIDDPLEIKDCDNVKRLDRVKGLFDAEIMTRLDNPKKGAVVIVAHRIAEDDLSGYAMQQKGWEQLALPLIAPRARRYKLGKGEVWQRKKGELLRPDAFHSRDIARLRATKPPGFETLYQQNPGGNERLRLKAEHFPLFALTALQPGLPTVISIDPGQKGGPTNSFSVIQVYAVDGDTYLLIDQWREQVPYRDFRKATRRRLAKFRPSAIVIEATGQGPALVSDITQRGFSVETVTPADSKTERLRKHRSIIRAGRVQIPENAEWREDFLAEAARFPDGAYADQMDALSQFLDWIAENPNPKCLPPRACAAGCRSDGVPIRLTSSPTNQVPGKAVLASSSRRTLNAPFEQPRVWTAFGDAFGAKRRHR